MAGGGSKFEEAGYAFPKPLIDIRGKTMIEVVIENVKPSTDHRFVFICQRDHYEKYDLHNIFKYATGDRFEVVTIAGRTGGAACSILCSSQYIDNDEELLIANADQYLGASVNDFLETARRRSWDGAIMTFKARHPRWSYVRTRPDGQVLEAAEKQLISDNATAGIYYFKRGSDFVRAAQSMIHKNITHQGEFYVCPAHNELILEGKKIYAYEIPAAHMFSLGTPEDLESFLKRSS